MPNRWTRSPGHTHIHHGRHTFISHALAGGRTLAEVRDAVGHGNATITSGYLHSGVDDDNALGRLFALSWLCHFKRSLDRVQFWEVALQ